MIELCEANKKLLENWNPRDMRLKEFVELFGKTFKLGRELGIPVVIF